MTNMTSTTFYLTLLICAAIIGLLIYFLAKPTRKTVINAPSVLTSIGIFGTFLGIAIGLSQFQAGDIVSSVPVFLDGIKLAFWSSVFGIAAALVHKAYFILRPYGGEVGNHALSKMAHSLEKLESLAEGQSKKIVDSFESSSAAGQLGAFGAKLESALGKISTSLENLESQASHQSQNRALALEKLDSIGSVFESGLHALKDSVTGLQTSLGGLQTEDLVDRSQATAMLGKLDAIGEKLETGFGSVEKSLLGGLEAVGGRLEAGIDANREATVGGLDAIGGRLEAGFGSAEDSMLGKIDAIGSRLEAGLGAHSGSVLGKLDNIGEKLEAGFGSAEDSMLGKIDAIGSRLEAGFGAHSGSVLGKLDNIGEKLEAGFGSDEHSMLGKLDAISGKLEEGFGAHSHSMLHKLGFIAEQLEAGFGSINESLGVLGQETANESEVVKTHMQRMLDELQQDSARDQAQSATLLQVFDDLKRQVQSSNTFEQELVTKLADIKGQLSTDSDLARQMAHDQIKSFVSTLEGMSAESIAELGKLSQKMDSSFGALLRANRDLLSEEFETLQAQLDSTRTRDEKLAADLAALSSHSAKSMVSMLKEILESSESSNALLANELAKLREDVAADNRATALQTDALLEQLRVMTDSYKASIFSTTAELKAQISKEMKNSYQLLDQYTRTVSEVSEKNQAEGLERLQGIANIMQTVVSSSSDMANLLHENTVAMKRMEDAFTNTSEGSLGRFLLNMNNETLAKLSSIEHTFSSQGPLGLLLQDLSVDNLAQLKSIESHLQNNQETLRELPLRLSKSISKGNGREHAI